MSAIYRKLFVLAILIAAFAVGMTFLLVSFKVENTHRELRHGRFDLIARDIDRVIEQNFSLGMNFSELTTLRVALDARKQADRAIFSIDVFDTTGVIAYSTEQDRIGQKTPHDWMKVIRQQQNLKANVLSNLIWRAWGEKESVAGTVVSNSFGQLKGYVAVRYSAAEERDAREQMRAGLAPVALSTFIATTILLFVVMVVLAKRFDREVVQACDYLQTASVPPGLRSSWESLIAPVIARFDGARQALREWRHAGDAISPDKVNDVFR